MVAQFMGGSNLAMPINFGLIQYSCSLIFKKGILKGI